MRTSGPGDGAKFPKTKKMKKYLLLFAVLGLFALASCGKDDGDKLTNTKWKGTGVGVYEGSSYVWEESYIFTSENEGYTIYSDTDDDAWSHTFTYTYTPPEITILEKTLSGTTIIYEGTIEGNTMTLGNATYKKQ